MLNFYNESETEVGVDEAGRGCLAGPIFAAAVIWDKDTELPGVRDSKKLSAKKRQLLRKEIEEKAIDFCVAYVENDEIDKEHIGIANMKAIHKAVDGLTSDFDTILVDGHYFKSYPFKSHRCIPQGDNKYMSIACASILAKTYHDDYITSLCDQYPQLDDYGWRKNMCYGTQQHRDAIVEHGITRYHRKSFAPCHGVKIRDDV